MRRPLSTLAALCLVLASLAWPASPVEAAAVPADSARVIVKFKADSPLLREYALSANARHADVTISSAARAGDITRDLGSGPARTRNTAASRSLRSACGRVDA